ncbi:MAG: hypothetical protein ACE5GM_10805 [bacterium]
MNENLSLEPVTTDLFLLDSEQREMVGAVEEFFKELQAGHSGYQIKNFVIGQFHTPDRKYHQCLLEMNGRYRGLVQLHYEYKKTGIEFRKQKLKIQEKQSALEKAESFAAELLRLEIEECENEIELSAWGLENLKRSIMTAYREMSVFKEELEQLEPLRKYQSHEEAEAEYWATQFAHEFLKGKRGESLPNIPDAAKLAQVIQRKLASGNGLLQIEEIMKEVEEK